MHQALAAIVLVVTSVPTWAQMTPVGQWHTIDDKTGEIKSLVVITDSAGVLSGRIDKLLRQGADQNARCDKCSDDRKDKPIVGLEIIRGVRKAEGKDLWEGGKILDPESGTSYTVKLTPTEGGKKLDMRASVFGIGRTQTWVRVQ